MPRSQVATIKTKFHFFQIAAKIPGTDPVVFQKALLQISPESFNAVVRDRTPHIFVLAIVDPMMGFKSLVQLIITFPHIAGKGRFQHDFPSDDSVERLFQQVVYRFHEHDAIHLFINAKDGLLQRLRTTAEFDLAGFSEGIAYHSFVVAQFGHTVGFIDFYFAIQQVNRSTFGSDYRVPQPREKSINLLIFQRQAIDNRSIRQI